MLLTPWHAQDDLCIGQSCIEASTRDAAMKAHAQILPAVAMAANDAAPAIREAAAQVFVAFAFKAGSMKPLEKV